MNKAPWMIETFLYNFCLTNMTQEVQYITIFIKKKLLFFSFEQSSCVAYTVMGGPTNGIHDAARCQLDSVDLIENVAIRG